MTDYSHVCQFTFVDDQSIDTCSCGATSTHPWAMPHPKRIAEAQRLKTQSIELDEPTNCNCDHCSYGAYIKELEVIDILKSLIPDECIHDDACDCTIIRQGIALIKEKK